MSTGGRESDPVLKWEACLVQEAGCALGTRTGKGKCQTQSDYAPQNLKWFALHHIYLWHCGCGCSLWSPLKVGVVWMKEYHGQNIIKPLFRPWKSLRFTSFAMMLRYSVKKQIESKVNLLKRRQYLENMQLFSIVMNKNRVEWEDEMNASPSSVFDLRL